ncbi:MAG TPA: hypothetical protein VFX17_02970 [Patescibacteria group bacterium]|nr:hypothetical protein [Patescibacteria group bacterium]
MRSKLGWIGLVGTILFLVYTYGVDWQEFGFTDPQFPVLRQINQRGRQVQKAIGNHMGEVIGSKDAAEIAKKDDPGAVLYDELKTDAYKSRSTVVALEKLKADAKGRRVHQGPVTSVDARLAYWTDTFTDLFEGEVLCASGVVQNVMYEQEGQVIDISPDGADVSSIDAYEPFDHRFPMMAFLGRVDHDVNKTFVIHSGCHPVPYSGHDFQVIVNIPYWCRGWEGTGQSNHHDRGNFTFTALTDPADSPAPNLKEDKQTQSGRAKTQSDQPHIQWIRP